MPGLVPRENLRTCRRRCTRDELTNQGLFFLLGFCLVVAWASGTGTSRRWVSSNVPDRWCRPNRDRVRLLRAGG